MSACSKRLVTADDEPVLLHQVCQVMTEVGGYGFAWVGVAGNLDSIVMVAQAGQSAAGPLLIDVHGARGDRALGCALAAIITGEPHVARGVEVRGVGEPSWAQESPEHQTSAIALPLLAGGQVLGALTVYGLDENAFEDEEKLFLRELSDNIALAIARLRSRKQTLVALRQTQDRYRLLVENAPLGIVACDAQGHVEELNSQLLAVLGSPSADLTRTINLLTFPPLGQIGFSAAVRKCLDSGQSSVSEALYRTAWGKEVFLRFHMAAIPEAEGNVAGVQVIFVDISESKKAEAALRQGEKRYRSLFDNMTEGLAYCRMVFEGDRPVDFVYLEVNRSFETLTGLKDVVGRSVSEVIPGIRESDPELFHRYGEVASTGVQQRFEIFVAALNSWFDISVYSPQRDHFIAVFDVITERKHTEQNVLRFAQRIERLTRVVQDLSRARHSETITTLVCQAARALTGADGAMFILWEGEQSRCVDEDAIAPVFRGRCVALEQCVSGMVKRSGQPMIIEDVNADARCSRQEYGGTPVRGLAMVPMSSGAPVGVIGVYWARPYAATDEDLRIVQALADSASIARVNVLASQHLEESEARTRAIYGHLPNPTLVWQRSGQAFVLAAFNEAAKAMSGGRMAGMLGQAPRHVLETFPDLELDLERCFQQREKIRKELESDFGAPQRPRRLVVTYGFIPPDMVLLHADDVTEQRRTEEHLRLAQRMEAIGRLAGGIAHDFNNLLSVIIGNTGFAMEAIVDSDPIRADLLEIKRASERAAALTRQILAFSRKQVLEPQVLDLNAIVQGMERLLRRLIGEDVELAVSLQSTLGLVKADPGQIEQVILNLASNSRDAMPQGGKLTIETANAEFDAAYTEVHRELEAGSYVVLSVTDTGCGMDPVTAERVFEPFFTTKAPGQGTGLGLATVYGIVSQSGGSISLYSEPGRGTTFKVCLPRELSAIGVAPRPVVQSARPSAGETILVVEDEDAVRRLAKRILTKAGYLVITASTGGEALSLCEARSGRVHLILTDVVMPRMSGRELAEKVESSHPDIKVLYMSGYTDNAISRDGVLAPGSQFIGKPFNAADLTRKVREVLDGGIRVG